MADHGQLKSQFVSYFFLLAELIELLRWSQADDVSGRWATLMFPDE